MIIQKYKYQKLKRNITAGSRHYTTLEGNNVPSVTTVLNMTSSIEKKEALAKWRKRTPNAHNVTKKAANVGTIMHRKLEEHIKGTLKSPGSNLGQQYGHNMAMTVINKGLINIDEIWGVEVSLYNSQLYAGTTDAVGLWKGRPVIIDFKQSNKIKKREWIEEYEIQCVAYALAHNEMFGTDIKTGIIMMCTNPESPEPLKYQEFVVEKNRFNEVSDIWWNKLEEYYIKHG